MQAKENRSYLIKKKTAANRLSAKGSRIPLSQASRGHGCDSKQICG